MKKTFLFLFLMLCSAFVANAQRLTIQYSPETKKGYYKKEIAVRFGSKEDIKKRATQWVEKSLGGGTHQAGAIWDMVITGSGLRPNVFEMKDKKGTLAYNFRIDVAEKKCTIYITDLINRDQLLLNDIERHAFKEDGSRRTNLARTEIIERVDRSINEWIEALEKAVNNTW
jgi:hypothetical protein